MKFAKSSEVYKENRAKLSAELGNREIFSVIDHWPLYSGVQTLSRFWALGELLQSTITVPGHIAEFGSYRGGSLMLFAKLLRIFDPNGSKEVHGFDSFEGLTNFSEHDVHDTVDSYAHTGQFKGSRAELEALIQLDGFQDDVTLHVGYIEDTLPPLLTSNPAMSFSLVMCDTDLYDSTKVVLEEMHPRLMKGGIFILDEWNAETFPGEGVAAREFLEAHEDECDVEHVFARQPTLVIRKK